MGGIGVGSIHAKNLGLLGKWKWRYLTGGESLKTSMAAYPRLFALDSSQDCTISEKWGLNGSWSGMWSWRCPPRGRAINDVSSLFSLISILSISGEGDELGLV
ncbi:hypothetical protein Tco_0244975 [Tanacetum coccineum]